MIKKKAMTNKAGAGKETRKEEMKEARMIKSGKMSPSRYASMESREYADGGILDDGPSERLNKQEYQRMIEADDRASKRQIAEVDAAEAEYRKRHNIPDSAKGYHHMPSAVDIERSSRGRYGSGGNSVPIGGGNRNPDTLMHSINPLKLADGGLVWDCTQGTGVRSKQDYKK